MQLFSCSLSNFSLPLLFVLLISASDHQSILTKETIAVSANHDSKCFLLFLYNKSHIASARLLQEISAYKMNN